MRDIHLHFEHVALDCLRMILSEPGVGVRSIAEVNPANQGAYGTFLADIDLVGGQKSLTITADFPLEICRATAPKTICKRAVWAALGRGEE